MINCTEQRVDILDKDVYLEHLIHVNSSTPKNLTIFPKFNSSHTTFCPITQLKVTKVFDIRNNDSALYDEEFMDPDEFPII